MRVLIADDNAVTRKALELALRKWGFHVESVSDGISALELFENGEHPHIAILDVMMPGMSGTELCRTVRAKEFTVAPYIILLTGMTEIADVRNGLDAGANDYVRKPFDLIELRARVNVGVRMVELQTSLANRLTELQNALEGIRRLEGLLPICSSCKNIRDDKGYWTRVEEYIMDHTNATFTHGICPKCVGKFFPEMRKS